MPKKPAGPMRLPWLLALLALLVASLLLLEAVKAPVQKAAAPLMRDASSRAQAAFDALRLERLSRGLPINSADDPNATGMIGDAYTAVTTTLGSLESKRSTTNPNLAAAIVDMFTSLGLCEGDRVAVNLSGSFPCANIAVLCALDALGLHGAVISSVGASTYGANLPAFTYLDMEAFLAREGFIAQSSVAFSLGGEGDRGLEMPQPLRDEILERLTGLGYALLPPLALDENIQDRYQRYTRDGAVKCFVNVGGNLTSFGNDSGMTTLPGGILASLPAGLGGNGLVQRFLRDGVPVLHLLNMKGFMADAGLPYDPVPLPAVGEGSVYWQEGVPSWVAVGLCAADLGAVAAAVVLGRRKKG